MKLLSPEEAANLHPQRKSGKSLVRLAIEQLEPKQILLIQKADWKQKKNPSYLCRIVEHKKRYKFTVETCSEGWIVTRLR